MWAAAPYRSEVGRAVLYWLSEDKRALLRKCMHFNEHITQIWKILRQLACSPNGHGASFWVSLHFSPHIGTLAAMVAGLVSLDCDAPCAKEDPRSRGTWASGDSSPSRAFPRRGVKWLLTFAHFSRTVASGDSSPSRAFPCRGIRWLLTLARFLMQGHQVTPHLRAFMRWLLCTARAPYHLEWVRERSPLHTAAADVGLVMCEWEGILYSRLPLMGLVSCEWECPSTHGSHWCGAGIMWMRVSSTHGRPLLGAGIVNKRAVSSRHGSHWWGAGIVWMREQCLQTRQPLMGAGMWIREQCLPDTAATDEGLVSCEWESSVFQTRQPLMRGWYRVNKRAVSSRHGSHWWGAGIVWIREQCLPDMAATDEGLVSCEWLRRQVIMFCTRQNTALRQGAACLDSDFSVRHLRRHEKPLAPMFFLGSPHRHGRGTWEAGLLSCLAGSTGERNADIVRHKLITKVLKSTTGQGQIDSS